MGAGNYNPIIGWGTEREARARRERQGMCMRTRTRACVCVGGRGGGRKRPTNYVGVLVNGDMQAGVHASMCVYACML